MVKRARQPGPMRRLLELNRKWLDAMEAHDVDLAHRYAAEMAKLGDFLPIDPEYQLLFKHLQEPSRAAGPSFPSGTERLQPPAKPQGPGDQAQGSRPISDDMREAADRETGDGDES
jgi:hypothetical protein